MADAATDNVTPRALRTRGVGASRAMPISQSVRPTATVQVMCTEGTLARESKPDEVEEIAATSRRRRNRHEQTQLQQHRQPLTACLSLCQWVTLSVSSSSPQPMTARPRGGRSVLPPGPARHGDSARALDVARHHPRLSAAAAAAHLHARPRPTRPCAQPQPDGDGVHDALH